MNSMMCLAQCVVKIVHPESKARRQQVVIGREIGQRGWRTIGNGVGEGHDDDGDKSGDCVQDVLPGNFGNIDHHESTHQDEGRAGGENRDAGCT